MFKVGDEVFIKAEITYVHPESKLPYYVKPCCGSCDWVSEEKIIPADKTYIQGLNDAWELARKIISDEDDGLDLDVLSEIFGTAYMSDIFDKYTYEEALAKIEAYEREKEIKVGDVVRFLDETKALVIDEALDNTVYILTENGCIEQWEKIALCKTNKQIPISGLLRQIGE